MDDKELIPLLDKTTGLALTAWMLAETAFMLATASRPEVNAREIIDRLLLTLERNQATVSGGPGAVIHARQLLESLLAKLPATRE